MSGEPAARRNLWPWVPVVGLVVVAIPNVALFVVTNRVRPALVEAQPYVASQHIDAEKARRADFIAMGFHLTIAVRDALHLECRLGAPTPSPAIRNARLLLYRPDDVAADRVVDWPDTTQPLLVELSKPGVWRAHLALVAGTTELESPAQKLDSGDR